MKTNLRFGVKFAGRTFGSPRKFLSVFMYNTYMFYLVGLGNPGEKYANTRHNVGWLALDHFIAANSLPSLVDSSAYAGQVSSGVVGASEVTVLYPTTYMNKSGSAVKKLVPKEEVGQLVVVHDEIDLSFGEVKVSVGRGAGGHNGVKSVVAELGSKDFVRVRVGIAPKSFFGGEVKRPAGGGPLERFVLKPFGLTERPQLPKVYEKVNDALLTILTDGVEAAMNKCN